MSELTTVAGQMKLDGSHANAAGLEGGDYEMMVSPKPHGMSFP